MKIITVCLIALATCMSCTLDYSQDKPSEELKEEIPNTVINNFVHTSVSEGAPVFRIRAREAKSFDNKAKTVLQDVYFEEYDTNRAIITHGSGDKAILYTDTENAEITGNIEFYSAKNEAWMWGDFLYWDNLGKSLRGNPNERVRIKTDDGTDINGLGFFGDLRRQEFSYSSGVKGTYDSEDNNTE
jgi:LPS export ABC transporter protein LptC